MASMPPISRKRETAKSQPNLLNQIGKAWNDLMHGKAGKAVKPAPPRPKEIKKPEAPRSPEKKAPPVQPEQRRPSNVAPRMCLPGDAPPQVIHRFDSAKFQKSESFGGLIKNRDRTHQVVQKQDKNGNWEVSVQPVNEGRVNPNQKAFLSKRRVSVADFNNRDSALFKSTVAATRRLNADSNRLPEPAKTPTQKPPTQADAPQNLGDWAKQQVKNAAGGASSAVTSTIGMVGSLPEHTVKAASGLVDGVKISANIISGGRIAPSALNPMVMDDKDKQYNSRTVVGQGTDRLQGKIDKTIGSDKNSFTYKATEFVAPLLVPTKGAKGGKPGGGGNPGGVPAPLVKPTSTAPLPTVAKVPGANNIVPFARTGTPLSRPTGKGPVGGTGGSGGVGGVGGVGGTGGTGGVSQPRGGNGAAVATIEAPARVTSAPPPVVAKMGEGLPRPVVNKVSQPVQPQLLKPSAQVGLKPGGAAPTLAPSALKPQQNPIGLPGLVKPDTAVRPTGDPASPFPQTIPSPANPATNPKRRVPGDLPAKPGGGIERSPEEQKKFDKWMDKLGDVRRDQLIKEYNEGRTTREEALNGRTGKDHERMSKAIEQIDRGRVGGSRGGSGPSGSGGNHSTSQVKDIWREVDQKGGIAAMPELTVRQLQGITEQGLKDSNLSAAENAELADRLRGANQAQGQYHKAREADKNNPPVDTSKWNLPMGGVVFGKQPVPGPVLPGLDIKAQGTTNSNRSSPEINSAARNQEPNQNSVLPSTLIRTADGVAVRTYGNLSADQKRAYDSLTAGGLSSTNINEIVDTLAKGKVGDLPSKFRSLSAHDLAALSILSKGLNGKPTMHDITHILLGDAKTFPYGVPEYDETVGNLIANRFINEPKGIFEGFSVNRTENGKLAVSLNAQGKEAIDRAIAYVSRNSPLLNSNFVHFFTTNSNARVKTALDEVANPIRKNQGTMESRYTDFRDSLIKNGQLPQNPSTAFTIELKRAYGDYEKNISTKKTQVESEAQIEISRDKIVSILATEAAKKFSEMPAATRRTLVIRQIASVLTAVNAFPSNVSLPVSTSRPSQFKRHPDDRFTKEWADLEPPVYNPDTGVKNKGFLGDFLEVERQVNNIMDAKAPASATPTSNSPFAEPQNPRDRFDFDEALPPTLPPGTPSTSGQRRPTPPTQGN
jgi:hypothetical protein